MAESRHDDKREKTTTLYMFQQGIICSIYSQKYLLSVNPASDIDKVRFSMVELGTGGKKKTDIYISIEDMRQLCEEIELGIAEQKIINDTGAYPQAYCFTTGMNGAKKLFIGGGKMGVRIQTQEYMDGKNAYKVIATDMRALRQMAFNFLLVMGLKKCDYYYKKLADAYWEAQKKRSYKASGGYDEIQDGQYVSHREEDDQEQTGIQDYDYESNGQLDENIGQTVNKSEPLNDVQESELTHEEIMPWIGKRTQQAMICFMNGFQQEYDAYTGQKTYRATVRSVNDTGSNRYIIDFTENVITKRKYEFDMAIKAGTPVAIQCFSAMKLVGKIYCIG